MKIAAIGDIHAPKYLQLLKEALNNAPQDVDLLLLCGDLILKGAYEHITSVITLLRSKYRCPIYACFGNEEYESVEHRVVELSKGDVVWLSDSMVQVKVSDITLSIIGTRGCLDRPTRWQLRNIPGIAELYEKRVKKVDELLSRASGKTLLLTHYVPTYLTLEGEDPKIWPELGCRKMESVILKRQPDIVIHAHAHRSTKPEAFLGFSKVFNASLPAIKKILTIELRPEASRKAVGTTLDLFIK